MKTPFAWLAAFLLAAPLATAQPEQREAPEPFFPSIVVTGRGESAGRPDRAVINLGAVAQAPQAAAAQAQVNQVVRKAIDQIKALGIPEGAIQTSGLSLQPVIDYRPNRPDGDGQPEQRIIGYQASNTVRVQVNDLAKIGAVVDAGVNAGANQVHGISFELRNDTEQRRDSLIQAGQQARAKAAAIAEAMGVRLGAVAEVVESGTTPVYPMMEMARVAMDASSGAPVQPGEVRVESTLTVRFRIQGEPGPRAEPPQPGRPAGQPK